MHTKLNIHKIEFPVTLGWSEDERREKQNIWVDFEIVFATPPIASTSDQLEDTYCYQTFSDFLYHKIEKKEYRLIEYLTHDIYQIAKNFFQNASHIRISLTKKPKLVFKNEGVSFTYGD